MDYREEAERLVDDWTKRHRFTRRIDGPLDKVVRDDLINIIATALETKPPVKSGKKEAVK